MPNVVGGDDALLARVKALRTRAADAESSPRRWCRRLSVNLSAR